MMDVGLNKNNIIKGKRVEIINITSIYNKDSFVFFYIIKLYLTNLRIRE